MAWRGGGRLSSGTMDLLSSYLLPTEREAPADAEALSHRMMVRAGLIRQLGAGFWSWMPSGWRVHNRITSIIREEMEAIGALEMLMPVLMPAEPWIKTGRYDIPEMFHLKDRKNAELVLAMTHEEAVTTHVAQLVRSYRDLPLILWHLQTKERDEPRPRAGVLRTREFIMKDAYSFDRDEAGLDESYAKNIIAYDRIFDRSGIEWYRVESDVGMMGGSGAHEYMAPCAAGENEVALAPGYAANVEVASADAQSVDLPSSSSAPEEVATPGLRTIEEVSGSLGIPSGALLKSIPIIAGETFKLAVVRGDHTLNEIKLATALGVVIRQAYPEEIEENLGPAGFLGPVGISHEIVLDSAVSTNHDYVAGANRNDLHLKGVRPGRDFSFVSADIRTVQAGDLFNGHSITIEPAIEVGNIFKLGTRYSEALGATFLDDDGTQKPIVMGSYGIGPARIAAAAVEQTATERGIEWPPALAPWDIEVIALGDSESNEHAAAAVIAAELESAGATVLFDDRSSSPGEKFADADLVGCPVRLTVGRKGLEKGVVEARVRGGEQTDLPIAGAGASALALWKELS